MRITFSRKYCLFIVPNGRGVALNISSYVKLRGAIFKRRICTKEANGTLSAKNGIWKGNKGLDIRRTEPLRIKLCWVSPGLLVAPVVTILYKDYLRFHLAWIASASREYPQIYKSRFASMVRNNCICYCRYLFSWEGGGGGGGGGIFEIFGQKNPGSPTSWNGLVHLQTNAKNASDPSPPIQHKTSGSDNN